MNLKHLLFCFAFFWGFSCSLSADESADDSISNEYEQKIENLQTEIKQLKEQATWKFETYLGTEQERDYNPGWEFIPGSIATSPYFGAFIYQTGSLWMYDFQVLKTYIDRNDEYDRTRWQVGVTRSFPFKIADKPATFKLRLGFRNDNWHYSSTVTQGMITNYETKGTLVRKSEERNEIWVRPTLSYRYNDHLSFLGSLSFRFIDRKLAYAPTGETRRDWSHIHEHFIGGTYRFNPKNALTVYYLYIDESLVNTLYNKEHFLWSTYDYKFDSGFRIMPYVRISLDRGKQSFRNWEDQETAFKKKDRSRYGFQLLYPITNSLSVWTDFYYRPEQTWQNGQKTHNHFTFVALELRYNF